MLLGFARRPDVNPGDYVYLLHPAMREHMSGITPPLQAGFGDITWTS